MINTADNHFIATE